MATNDRSTEAPKPLAKSKTVIVNAVIAIAALFPPVQAYIAEHPALVLTVISAANVGLRLITKGRIQLFEE